MRKSSSTPVSSEAVDQGELMLAQFEVKIVASSPRIEFQTAASSAGSWQSLRSTAACLGTRRTRVRGKRWKGRRRARSQFGSWPPPLRTGAALWLCSCRVSTRRFRTRSTARPRPPQLSSTERRSPTHSKSKSIWPVADFQTDVYQQTSNAIASLDRCWTLLHGWDSALATLPTSWSPRPSTCWETWAGWGPTCRSCSPCLLWTPSSASPRARAKRWGGARSGAAIVRQPRNRERTSATSAGCSKSLLSSSQSHKESFSFDLTSVLFLGDSVLIFVTLSPYQCI